MAQLMDACAVGTVLLQTGVQPGKYFCKQECSRYSASANRSTARQMLLQTGVQQVQYLCKQECSKSNAYADRSAAGLQPKHGSVTGSQAVVIASETEV
eukprot:scaffold100242_cov18-Tisochrysis_lutea.AAC.1